MGGKRHGCVEHGHDPSSVNRLQRIEKTLLGRRQELHLALSRRKQGERQCLRHRGPWQSPFREHCYKLQTGQEPNLRPCGWFPKRFRSACHH